VAGIAERAVRALMPYVGSTVADTCVRATALTLGKTLDTLSDEDLPAMEDRARRLLEPLLPPATINRVVGDIWGRTR
jgi:hypothetical protein